MWVKYALAQEITNRAVLTQIGNRSKSAKLAERYLKEIAEKFPKSLELQSIPENTELWKLENFESFLAERRKMLAKELNKFLNEITETKNEEVTVDLLEMIEAGENQEVEFKQTLRYDIRQNSVNKDLENVIIKTIAAFSNNHGGTLIMGVSDDYEIIGLENDYSTLKDGSKDGFELHLRNLLNQAFGAEYAATQINVTFPVVKNIEICVVEIKPGTKPLFTQFVDKFGFKKEAFYLRSGNSSPELPMSEAARYIRSRFPNIL